MNYLLPETIKKNERPIIIYGTGEVADCFFRQLEELSLDYLVTYFVSSYSSGTQMKGRNVLHIEEIELLTDKEDYSFLIASYGSSFEMKTILCTYEVPSQHIFVPDITNLGRDNGGRFWPKLHKAVGSICFYPPVTDEGVKKDLLTRISWYIPDRDSVQVIIPEDKDVPSKVETILDESDLILVWDKNGLQDPNVLQRQNKAAIVDPTYSSIKDSIVYSRIHYWTLTAEERAKIRRQSIKNFAELQTIHCRKETAYVFGTGPSLGSILKHPFDESTFKLICNKIVTNPQFMSHIKPDVLVFSDSLFFSYSEFGTNYRHHVEEFIKAKGRYIIVPEQNAALLLYHYPNIADKIIGVTVDDGLYRIPSPKQLSVKETGNVLTRLGIPVASAIAGNVRIIGCDGTQSTAKESWSHSEILQYDTLKLSAYTAHPSTFETYSLSEYYEKHCAHMEALLQFGESQGVRYDSLTPSYIPALNSRYSN